MCLWAAMSLNLRWQCGHCTRLGSGALGTPPPAPPPAPAPPAPSEIRACRSAWRKASDCCFHLAVAPPPIAPPPLPPAVVADALLPFLPRCRSSFSLVLSSCTSSGLSAIRIFLESNALRFLINTYVQYSRHPIQDDN